jgi:hypothetical protein
VAIAFGEEARQARPEHVENVPWMPLIQPESQKAKKKGLVNKPQKKVRTNYNRQLGLQKRDYT